MNNEIRCNVGSCKYNEQQKHCTLDSIQVGSQAVLGEAKKCKDTECSSFQES